MVKIKTHESHDWIANSTTNYRMVVAQYGEDECKHPRHHTEEDFCVIHRQPDIDAKYSNTTGDCQNIKKGTTLKVLSADPGCSLNFKDDKNHGNMIMGTILDLCLRSNILSPPNQHYDTLDPICPP